MKNHLFNPGKHHRKSIRKKGYDYSREGLYFITICVHNKKCLFGEISVGANNHSPDNHSPDNHSPDNHSPDNHSPDNYSPQMVLNDAGRIANECWLNIPEHFPNVILHDHIVMPNHVHGIIEIVGAKNFSPQNQMPENQMPENQMPDNHSPENQIPQNQMPENHSPQNQMPDVRTNNHSARSPSKTIGSVVRGFKIGVTKWFRNHGDTGQIWQRNYWENIIRDENAYYRISKYIVNNPVNWNNDKFNRK